MIPLMLGLGGAGLGLNIAGGLLDIGASRDEARAIREASYQNASMLERDAVLTGQAMERETKQLTDQGRSLKSTQRAIYSASGADTSGDTPLIVMMDQAAKIQSDVLNARRNKLIEVQGLRHQAKIKRWEGDVAVNAADSALFGQLLGLGGSAAGSAGSILGNRRRAAGSAGSILGML